eukprot:sb/3461073/
MSSASLIMDHGIDEAELYELEMEARLAEEEEIMREMEQSQNQADDEVTHWKKLQVCKLDMSDGGVMVSIVAFQAVDPGSIPGHRTDFLGEGGSVGIKKDKENQPPNSAATESQPDSYPVIEFSFMNEPTPAPIQISNAYKRKATSTAAADFGLPEALEPLHVGGDVTAAVVPHQKRSRADLESAKVFNRIPDGDYLRVNTEEKRVFLKVRRNIPPPPPGTKNTSGHLLAQPFEYIKNQVMRGYHDKVIEVAAAVDRIRSHVVPAQIADQVPIEANLWVDKFLPKKYVELLSDDGVNRQVLHWLKLWDGIVFGRKMREKAPVQKPKWATMEEFQRWQRNQEPDYDEKGFPFKKTVLLAGPPGLGKTTLAHVTAQHAGYNVVEMNASDDRNYSKLTKKSVRWPGIEPGSTAWKATMLTITPPSLMSNLHTLLSQYRRQTRIGSRVCKLDMSDGGVMVSIVAFQAVDPGSIPGHRTDFLGEGGSVGIKKDKENQPPNSAATESQPDSYPVIEFSFMNEPTPAPIQISNAYKRKATSTAAADFGLPEALEPLHVGGDVTAAVVPHQKRSRADLESAKVFNRIPDGDYLRVNTEEKRVFLKVRRNIPPPPPGTKNISGHLLAQPFEYIKNQVMRGYHDKVIEVAAAVDRIRSHVVPAQIADQVPIEANLWVDKFLPKKYVELLSDDGVNRQVLHWLKLWDGIVFGRKMREKAPVQKPKWATMEEFQRWQRNQEPDYDEKGFPFKKTVLLAGPPGLGKTTLAHVTAQHAGYNVVEMNASDDRGAAQFSEAIENAVRMTASLTGDKRPNCLVIDEIDGAGAPAIQVLVKVLMAGSGGPTEPGEKKKKKDKRLRRPIICICNDPWVAALRDLRRVATIITFPPTQSARLAYRLKSICSVQQLTADMASLLYLCEKTDNDIRSSLNTLQFLRSKQEPLSMVRIKGMDVGAKDRQQSLFKFWSSIFTQAKKQGNALSKSNQGTQKRLEDLISLVMGTGEYERQVDGIHENLLNLKIRDAKFSDLAESLDWFLFYDTLDQEVRHTMNFELGVYSKYVPIAFHLLFSQIHPPKVVIPQKQRETRLKQQFTNTNTRFLHIQLYSAREKEAKDTLVSLMACYDLQFVQRKTPEGLTQYVLEPDLYALTTFSTIEGVKQLPYSIKQMLAREVDLKRIGGVDTSTKTTTTKDQVEEEEKVQKKTLPKIDFTKEEKAPVNYLSKIVRNKEAFSRKKDAYVQKDRTFFKFNEGFSNAELLDRVMPRRTNEVCAALIACAARLLASHSICKVRFKRLDLRFLEIQVLRVIFTKRDPEFPGISGQVV